MNSRERVTATLEHRPIDRVPRHLWALPGVFLFRSHERDALLSRYPEDFAGPAAGLSPSGRCAGTAFTRGASYTDEWGCTFEVAQTGLVGEVKTPIIGDEYEGLEQYDAPWKMLENLRPDLIEQGYEDTDKFVLAGTHVRPFERLQFLRGTENLYIDIAQDAPEMHILLNKLHAFYLEEMKFWASARVDGVSMMDDWGSQRNLLINPVAWRRLFKPLYKEYCDILHRGGKKVFFHSDGWIESIYGDLAEIGVDAVNSQLFCMDMEKLGREYGGKIAFWGEIDRQYLLPRGTEEEIRRGVRRAAAALCPDGKLTGVIAQCEMGINDPLANVEAVFSEWDRISETQHINSHGGNKR